jgi:biofilm PGA synthesis N-glycosyltransferase PgaC
MNAGEPSIERTMADRTYVLVTPAHNEQETIETTINSVVSQTIRPNEWVVVSDRSTDQTDEIVRRYMAGHDFIRLLRLEGHPGHSFAAVVQATEAGVKALTTKDYAYVGLLDADVRFAPDYYEKLIVEFEADPELGLAGGLVQDVINGQMQPANQDMNQVAGATQFFRRECFESLKGLLAIPEGGWDAVTCIRARMNGFGTRTFPDNPMDHLKPRNSAFGHPLSRKWQLGVRDYALASHPLFEIAKCGSRVVESPFITGATVRLAGFFWSGVVRRQRILPSDLRKRLRDDQMKKLSESVRRFFGKGHKSPGDGSPG